MDSYEGVSSRIEWTNRTAPYSTVDSIATAAKGCDAIVFTAGSGGKTGDDKTLLIDLDGAGKTIEAAEKAGIDRFIMVSAIQANNRDNWHHNILPYYAAVFLVKM